MLEFKNEFINKKIWPFCCGFLKSLLNALIIFAPALILSLPKLISEKIFFIDFSFAVSLIYSFAFLSSAIFYKYTEDANKIYSCIVEFVAVIIALLILLTSFNKNIEQPLLKWSIINTSAILMWLSYSFIEHSKRNPINEIIKEEIDQKEKSNKNKIEAYSKNIKEDGSND